MLKLSGMDALKTRIRTAQARIPDAMEKATWEALQFLEQQAQINLDVGIYEKTRPPYADRPTYELYNAFVQDVIKVGTGDYGGILGNTSPHAPFIEHGTDDEGLGEHFVAPVKAKALHWLDPETGENLFSKGHWVSGIKPLRFMERALIEHEQQVIDIYALWLRDIFKR